ncbi:MAG: MmcQ/YjbR family DNA-binding protein [Algibacter sp.]|uniref:MmcQ/YjbR family DNA-binding protein n=1 Tax=Algibacter sp. TaxID=1872428 RepID=UPI002617FC44|nr:MmcQ/YjbR family DNA-binding protein [Algibacter sp.]MDG1729508.1 MmcQ/YjbR family DNA-binding protein [Algibacter sp.]MDG2178273.1 MmcQ/YjbR family DNA-binding protein [Algibacter sp.]
MNIEQIREYCLSKKGTTESFPFDKDTLVFKVLNKMFVIAPLNKWESGEASITLKSDPIYTVELREQYESVYPGPYVSNKHWNTIAIYKGELPAKFILELIDHSYSMVLKGMSKKLRATL